jgi:transcriptional regulator with XRE-family HTH domain
MHTQQSVISRIEGGGQIPTVGMLARVARATGQRIEINLPGDIGLAG